MKNAHGGKRAGAAMPPKYGEPTVRMSLRIPKTLYDALKNASQDMTLSEYIVRRLR